ADEGKQVDLTEAILSVGRDSTNQIRLHDTEVSRRHAEFRLENGDYKLIDIGSANGTFVNNEKVNEIVLHSGDQILIGQSVLVYTTGRTGDAPDLPDQILMIARQDDELSSAIIKTIGEAEGGRILAQPDQAGTPWLKNALANLSIMYETI